LINPDDIAAHLWKDPQNIDVSNGINTAVNRLRYTLNDDTAEPVYIETVIGLGYRFIAAVEQASRKARDSAAARRTWKPHQANPPTSILRMHRRSLDGDRRTREPAATRDAGCPFQDDRDSSRSGTPPLEGCGSRRGCHLCRRSRVCLAFIGRTSPRRYPLFP